MPIIAINGAEVIKAVDQSNIPFLASGIFESFLETLDFITTKNDFVILWIQALDVLLRNLLATKLAHHRSFFHCGEHA